MLYVFDYGAPTGFRLAMAHPERIVAIVSKNGNAYEEGLGDAWAPIQRYWQYPSAENRETLRLALDPAGLRSQYLDGMCHPEQIDPVVSSLDTALMARPGNMEIQLELFLDYANTSASTFIRWRSSATKASSRPRTMTKIVPLILSPPQGSRMPS